MLSFVEIKDYMMLLLVVANNLKSAVANCTVFDITPVFTHWRNVSARNLILDDQYFQYKFRGQKVVSG